MPITRAKPLLKLPTRKRILELLSYDPMTGEFSRKVRSSRVFPGDRVGYIDRGGYLIISIDSQEYKAHRIAWKIVTGRDPTKDIDHINGVTLDNSFANLREVTRSDNLKNSKIRSDNTSGYPGVFWSTLWNRWIANIGNKGDKIYLGCFTDLEDAISARKAAEKKYGFHENHGRKGNPTKLR